MADFLTGSIRTVHVLSGAAVAGGVLIWSLLLTPSIQKRLPGQLVDQVMGLLGPRVVRYLDLVSLLALVSGLTLLGRIYGFDNIWGILTGGSIYGNFLLAGLILFIVIFAAVYLVFLPLAKKLEGMMAKAEPGTPPSPAAMRLIRQLAIVDFAIVGLTIGIVIAMAAAVNVRS